MFKGLWLWIRGLFGLGAPVEETPKLSKESIDRVGKIMEEVKHEAVSARSVGQSDQADPTNNASKKGFGNIKVIESMTIQRSIDGPIEVDIVNGKHRTASRAGAVAHLDHAGNLMSIEADHDGRTNPTQKAFHRFMEMSVVTDPGIDPMSKILQGNTTAAGNSSDSEGDTPVPVQRKPRRRGKRGGRGRNKNKK